MAHEGIEPTTFVLLTRRSYHWANGPVMNMVNIRYALVKCVRRQYPNMPVMIQKINRFFAYTAQGTNDVSSLGYQHQHPLEQKGQALIFALAYASLCIRTNVQQSPTGNGLNIEWSGFYPEIANTSLISNSTDKTQNAINGY